MNDLAQCPICKETHFSPYLSCKDYTVSFQTFQLRKCVGCGFVVTSPRPDEAMLPAYYQSAAYISHSNSSKGLFDQAYKMARTFTSKWKYNIVNQHCTQKPQSLLDFGCGTGTFLKHCKDKGLEVAGVEPSDVARRQAKQITAQDIASEIGQLSKTFDAITLWHVLEHVYDLHATIQMLKGRLNDKGTMFIAVPNHRSFDANFYAEHWAAYDVPRHLWHFSKQTMERLLKNHDFKLNTVLPMPLDSFYVSLLSEKYKTGGSGISNVARAVRSGLKSNKIAKITGEYSSLIYIAHP